MHAKGKNLLITLVLEKIITVENLDYNTVLVFVRYYASEICFSLQTYKKYRICQKVAYFLRKR